MVIVVVGTSIRFVFLKPTPVLADSLFKFDEGYGSNINDSNQNVSSGTITGAVWKTSEFCRDDKCLYFDGSGDLVSFADDADLDFVAADDFTVTGWFRHPIIATNPDYLVAKHQNTTAGGYKVYMDSDGDMVFGIDDDGTWDTTDIVGDDQSKNFDDNKWHHFAAQKDGTTGIYLYVDGNLIDSDTSLAETGTLANAASFYIGIDADGTSNGWSGFIDEVKVYRSLRTAAEIKADFIGETPSRGTATSFGPDTSWISSGLIGYWKMDETAANSCGTNDSCDSSGNANDGAWNGNTANTTGKYGNGTSYDGTTDYTSITDSTSLHLNDFTIEGWYKTTTTSVTQGLVSKRTSFATMDWELYLNNGGSIYMQIGESGADTIFGTCAYTANTWQHVTAVKSGTAYSMYRDGILCSTDTSAITWTDSENLVLGALTTSGGNALNGTLDDVRIYNRALTPAEVSKLYSWAPGPVGHWKMDEGSWNNNCSTDSVFDSSGNGNNGDSCPASTGPTGGTIGKFGSSGDLDGSNDYLLVADSASLDVTANFTISAWIYPDTGTLAASKHLVSKDGVSTDTDDAYNFYLGGGSAEAAYLCYETNNRGTSPRCSTSASVSTGRWQHVAIAFDGSTASMVALYLNGVKIADDGDTTQAPIATATNLLIGRRGSDAAPQLFNGKIDDVRIYNYTRSAGQIIEDMNAGHPAPGSPVGSAVAHWKFDEGALNTCSGGTNDFCDSSINVNDLAAPPTTTILTNAGKFGKAINATGAVWATRADDSDFDFAAADDLSMNMWLYADAANKPTSGNVQYLYAKGGIVAAGTVGYILYTNSSGNVSFGIRSTSGNWVATPPAEPTSDDKVTSTADLYDSAWHHIVAVKTGTSRIDLFVDGKLNASDTSLAATGTLVNSVDSRFVDRNASDDGDEFIGKIDEVKIFRSALTGDQVKVLYNQSSQASLGSLSTDASGSPSNSSTDSYCPPGESVTCTAPKLEWKLDENTGTSNNDTSGNGATGVWTGTPRWVSGVQGSALNFNGSSDSLKYTPTSWTCSTSGCTVSLWVKADRTGQSQYSASFASSDAGSAANTFQLDIGGAAGCSGMYRLYGQDSAAVAFPVCFDTYTTNWIHLLVTVTTTGTITTYMNGVYKNQSTPASGFTGSFARYKLGQSRGGSDFFAGNIDQVKVYDRVLTQQEIAWDYNRGAPTHWYKFDECTGATANNSAPAASGGDSSADGTINPVSLSNTTTGTCNSGTSTEMWNDGTSGKFNGSLGFDDTDDYVNVPTPALPTGDFTYTVWMYRIGGTSNTILGVSDGAGGDELRIRQQSNNTIQVTTNNATVLSSSTTLASNTWYHIAVTRSGSTVTSYTNGISDGSGTDGTVLNFSTCDLLIGADNNTSGCTDSLANHFNGQLDDVRIYNYALTPQQVKTVMGEGAVRFGPLTGSP